MILGRSQEARAQAGQETVYRITVAKNLDESKAQDFKLRLEGLGFVPVYIERQGGSYVVLYGNFPSTEAAVRQKQHLQEADFAPEEIVPVTRGVAAPGPNQAGKVYTVVVQEFFDIRQAQGLKSRLENDGYLFVNAVQAGSVIQVTVGQFREQNGAQNLLADLREKNYTGAKIAELNAGAAIPIAVPPSAPLGRPPGGATPPGGTQASAEISMAITDSELWKSLNDDQKRKVMDTMMLSDRIRAGDDMAQRIAQLEKRLDSLDKKEREVTDMILKEREAQAKKTVQITTLFRDANNLARGKRYNEAILKLRDVLQIDPSNQEAQTRIHILEGYLKGERYDGQEQEMLAKYEQIKADADAAEKTITLDGLNLARALWNDIKTLNPEKYGVEAKNKINKIENSIAQLHEAESKTREDSDKKQKRIWQGLIAGVGFLFVLVAFLSLRSRKQHRELMTKIHEITSVRPMRELEMAGGGGKLTAGGVSRGAIDQSESDLFAPVSDSLSPMPGDPLAETFVTKPPTARQAETAVDSLFGEAPTPKVAAKPSKGAPKKGGKAPLVVDDPFGMPPDTETSAVPVEDVFGTSDFTGEEPSEPPVTAPSKGKEPATAEMSFDDVFSDLPSIDDTKSGTVTAGKATTTSTVDDTTGGFSMEDIFGTAAEEQHKPAPKQKAPTPKTTDESMAISFGDLLTDTPSPTGPVKPGTKAPAPAAAAASVAPPPDDPFSIFEESSTADVSIVAEPATQKAPASKAPAEAANDPFAGTPFASIFGDNSTPGTDTTAPQGLMGAPHEVETKESSQVQINLEDDTEIPAIKLDIPDEDPFAALAATGPSRESKPAPKPAPAPVAPSASSRKPAVSDGGSTTVIPEGAHQNGLVFVQSFEQDPVGAQPSNWTGNYPYSSLTVHDDSPPKGAKRYVVYHKDEGAGKVYYCAKFPNTGGILSVEFDLRCNDKNKFLLGFYIEKDEDFQQSIHTKILRSEAQTAPTIHIQGEPAPYLLGSWAHIKYMINLKEGTVDGYIDSTHIARGLKLPQAPKYLNTLAIRDNINTTGDLCIANLQVQKVD